MATNVAVGPGRGAGDAAPVPRRTVSTDSIRSVVGTYVSYRSSLQSRRTTNDSRRSDVVDDEDLVDGPVSDEDNRVVTNLPPGLENALRALCLEFEQRYEQASCRDGDTIASYKLLFNDAV